MDLTAMSPSHTAFVPGVLTVKGGNHDQYQINIYQLQFPAEILETSLLGVKYVGL